MAQQVVGSASSGVADRGADEHAAERLVAGRDALGEGDQVGHHAVVLGRRTSAEPAEAADDLVEDEERAGGIAQPRRPSR